MSLKQREVVLIFSIYQAATIEQAEDAPTAFAQKWIAAIPTISQLWLRHWERIILALLTLRTFGEWFIPPMPSSPSTALCVKS